jgi:hypothetical protein
MPCADVSAEADREIIHKASPRKRDPDCHRAYSHAAAGRSPGWAKHLAVQWRERSGSSRPVDIGAVLDSHHGDQAPLAVNAVDHAIIAAAGACRPARQSLSGLPTEVRA